MIMMIFQKLRCAVKSGYDWLYEIGDVEATQPHEYTYEELLRALGEERRINDHGIKRINDRSFD